MPNNHVIDPTFFNEAIETFSFDNVFYRRVKQGVDEFYEQKVTYTSYPLRGSLQSQGTRIVKRPEGNIIEIRYNFYCKSIYRIDKGDLIIYKNDLLRVEEMHPYDEYGVRSCRLLVVDFSGYQDLLEYLKYQEGRELI